MLQNELQVGAEPDPMSPGGIGVGSDLHCAARNATKHGVVALSDRYRSKKNNMCWGRGLPSSEKLAEYWFFEVLPYWFFSG